MVAIKNILDVESIADFADGCLTVHCVYIYMYIHKHMEKRITTVKLCQLRYFTLDSCKCEN